MIQPVKTDAERIAALMQVFAEWDSSFRAVDTEEKSSRWQPVEGKEEQAFNELISLANRAALKSWYARHDVLNAHAELFRRTLERETGSSLPLRRANRISWLVDRFKKFLQGFP